MTSTWKLPLEVMRQRAAQKKCHTKKLAAPTMADAAFDGNPTAPVLVWIGLILTAAVSFWAQALITEERFVPSLNVIASRFNIPDDVAGATLMAAGASSPELFASFVSLFITHSSLGIGTIVGSEIFNQLAISAGSILASRNSELYLSKAILLREAGFYGLALAFLLVSLSDRRSLQDEYGNEETYIFITWDKGLLLMMGYVAYVIVCAYFERIVSTLYRLFGFKKQQDVVLDEAAVPPSGAELDRRTSSIVALPFLRQLRREPRSNFHGTDSTPESTIEILRSHSEVSGADYKLSPEEQRDSYSDANLKLTRSDSTGGFYGFLVAPTQPDQQDVHGLEEIDRSGPNSATSCFLWQRSSFYNKTRVDIHAWRLRWFTFHHDGISSVPDRGYHPEEYRYPAFERIEVDEAHLVFRLCSANRTYTLMAPSAEVLRVVLDACNHMERTGTTLYSEPQAELEAELEAGHILIDFPHGASRLEQALHTILFPLKFLFHVTIPDSRRDVAERVERRVRDATLAIIACIMWIVVLSYAMVASLEYLGELMRIPSAIIGVTVSAAGTSLPNYVASQVAARQGFGNMAVSNAFGSNTFNIFVGLGVPWTLKTMFTGEYSDLRDDGITESVMILAVVLVGYMALVVFSKFVLYKWHAYLFYLTYLGYLGYAIGQVFI